MFRTFKPAAADVDGNVRSFFTRKGFYGHALQAFSDGNCKFVHISQRVCASTHDSTAYVLTGISESIMKGQLPQWAHIVLDEAYKCTEQELSPWKGKNLPEEKDTFNIFFSVQPIGSFLEKTVGNDVEPSNKLQDRTLCKCGRTELFESFCHQLF